MSSKCTYTPPPGQDITPYMIRLQDIITQLNIVKDKRITLERIDLLIAEITTAISETK
jgi:predicted acetyltransferase